MALRGLAHYPQGYEVLDNSAGSSRVTYMNKNMKRPQSPKRINRHDSARLDKGRFTHEMRAPRYNRNEDRMMILGGRYEA